MAELGTNLIISTVTSVHVSLVELQTKVREDFTITALLHYIHNKDTYAKHRHEIGMQMQLKGMGLVSMDS